MPSWKDDVRADYEDMKDRFRDSNIEDFKSGDWFASFVQWMLENYAKKVDSKYIIKKYPGAGSANQAKKAIKIASRYNSIAGGMSAAAVSALELSSMGPQALITVPAIGGTIMADVGYCTRTQLRSTYDLSMIHGAPLSIDDVEDCYLVFLTAMGVKVHELAGGLGKALGPHIVAYNVRKILRSGLRKGLQEVLKKIGGVWLARKLTERAMMRLLVPGISVPIAAGFNYVFTKRVLKTANSQMYRRGRVVQPLVKLYKREPTLDKSFAVKALISVVDAGDSEGWGESQMDALRYCQSALSLTDDELATLENWFDRGVADLLSEMPKMDPKAVADLVELLAVAVSMYPTDQHDEAYATSLAKISKRSSQKMTSTAAQKTIKAYRSKLI